MFNHVQIIASRMEARFISDSFVEVELGSYIHHGKACVIQVHSKFSIDKHFVWIKVEGGFDPSQSPQQFETIMYTVNVYIIGNWKTLALQVNPSHEIAQLKSQIKDRLCLDCSTYQMKVFNMSGKLSFKSLLFSKKP